MVGGCDTSPYHKGRCEVRDEQVRSVVCVAQMLFVRQGGPKTKKRGRKSVQRIGRRGKRRADKKPTPAGFPAGEYFALGDIQLYEAALRLSPIFIPDTSGLRCPLFSALIAVAQGIRRL